MKKSVLMRNYPVLMIAAFMLFAAAGLGYAVTNYYVWRDNLSPAAPYTNWAMAADNIQAAVDRTSAGDTVYVTNGIYDTGGMKTPSYQITNRVCITRAITVRSMNGPGLTIIQGSEAPGGGMGTGAVRCAYLANVSASLIGFTLTNGYTMTNGDYNYDQGCGGIFICANAIVSNCVIAGNTVKNRGGGVVLWFGGTMNNCLIINNTSGSVGGGANFNTGGTMNNCTVAGNVSAEGGGVFFDGPPSTLNNCTVVSNRGTAGGVYLYYGGTLNNCTVVSNTATSSGGGLRFLSGTGSGKTGTGVVNNCIVWQNTCASGSNISFSGTSCGAYTGLINYTCSGPAQTSSGNGNIGSDPMLVNIDAGNYRLTNGSPCINAGTNISWMTDSADVRCKDLDGHSRIDRFSDIVDMGAYEYLNVGTMFIVR